MSRDGSLRRPLAQSPLGVSLDDTGMLGVDTMDESLNLCISNTQLPAKIRANTDHTVYLSCEHESLRLRH